MNGFKTIITAFVSVVGGVATMMGVVIDPQVLAEIAANIEVLVGAVIALQGLVFGVLRAFTSAPIFNGKRVPGASLNGFIVPLFLVGFIVSMVGCTAQPRIQTPEDQVAVAYATIDALTTTTKQLFVQGRIDRSKKNIIAQDLRQTKNRVQLAENLILQGRPQDGVQALLILNRALLTIEADLREASQ